MMLKPSLPRLIDRGLRVVVLGDGDPRAAMGVTRALLGDLTFLHDASSLLVAQGFEVTKSFQFTLIITLAQLPGYALAAVLVEAWGRRSTLALFLVGSAVAAWFFGQSDSATSIIVAGSALSFCNLGAWGALYAIGPELYPTALRGRGTGAAAGFGRIASIVAPLAVPVLLGAGGAPLLFVVFAACFLLAAAAAWGLVDRSGAALDDR